MSDYRNYYEPVEAALETIRPYLRTDGGDISLIEITEDLIVKVKLTGACHDCPMSIQTLKGGVEMVIRQAVPDINKVVAI